MYDIAVFLYRNNHPCIFRYLCGWHNEVNYYSFRGQLSVYYAAVRLNLTDYLHFLPESFILLLVIEEFVKKRFMMKIQLFD